MERLESEGLCEDSPKRAPLCEGMIWGHVLDLHSGTQGHVQVSVPLGALHPASAG